MNAAVIGVIIFVISVIGGVLLATHNASDQQRQTKILLFVLYFWLLTFVQLIITAIAYSLITGF